MVKHNIIVSLIITNFGIMNKQQPIGVITGTSSKGEGVQIKDFGSFVVRRRAACTGRNLHQPIHHLQ
jgi:nucleoid DNA-binding protein